MPSDFTKRFGAPSPPVPTDIRFRGRPYQDNWQAILRETGSGWFMNRFLYLFGAGLQRLTACTDAWSFLVPPGKERIILGRNAYGTLLVLEEPEGAQTVHLLDPIRVAYWTDPDIELLGLVGRYLPRRNLPHFFEDDLYRLWVPGDDHLPDDTIIAPITPASLGGKLVPANFHEEEIVTYYQSTAPIYAKAFDRMARAPHKKRVLGRGKGK
jgi:hypothetical protein